MTLRVTFEIVPFGEEESKYTVGTLNIHNVKSLGLGSCEYDGTYKLISHPNFCVKRHFNGVLHNRQEGFLELTRKVIEHLDKDTSDYT